MNWLIEQGKADSKTTRFYVKLANELVLASNNQVDNYKGFVPSIAEDYFLMFNRFLD